MIRCLAVLALTWGLVSACVVVPGSHPAPGYYQPVLVAVSPGVWVVEDYHTAVFFCRDHYWYYDSSLWYRSTLHDGGWVVVSLNVVPAPVVELDRTRYVWYRAPAAAERMKREPQRANSPPGHGGSPPGHGGIPPGHSKGHGKSKKKHR